MKPFPEPLDLSKIRVYPVAERKSLSRIDQLLVDPEAPPAPAPAAMVQSCVEKIRAARQRGASVMLLYGAHLIKNGGLRIVNSLIRDRMAHAPGHEWRGQHS